MKSFVAGRKMTTLLLVVFMAVLQVFIIGCHSSDPAKEDSYVKNRVVENRVVLATEMFKHVSLDKASKMMNISPLVISDIVPADAGNAQGRAAGEGEGGNSGAGETDRPRRKRRPTKN